MRLPDEILIPRPKWPAGWSVSWPVQWPEPATRRRLYLAAEAACVLLVGYGVLTGQQVLLAAAWMGVMLEMARQNVVQNVEELVEVTDPVPSSTPPEQMPSPEQDWRLDDAMAADDGPDRSGDSPLQQVPQHLLHDGATDWSNDEYWAVAESDERTIEASTPIADAIERSLAQGPLDVRVAEREPFDTTQDHSESP